MSRFKMLIFFVLFYDYPFATFASNKDEPADKRLGSCETSVEINYLEPEPRKMAEALTRESSSQNMPSLYHNPHQIIPSLWHRILSLVPTVDYMNAALVSKNFYRYVHDNDLVLAHFEQIVTNRRFLGIRFIELEMRFNSLWPPMDFHAADEHFELGQVLTFEEDFIEDIRLLWKELSIHHMWLKVSPSSLEGQDLDWLQRYQNFLAEPENPNNLDKNPAYLNHFSNHLSFNLILKAFYIKNTLKSEGRWSVSFLKQVTRFLPSLCNYRLWLCSNDRWQPPEWSETITISIGDGLPGHLYVNENGFLENVSGLFHESLCDQTHDANSSCSKSIYVDADKILYIIPRGGEAPTRARLTLSCATLQVANQGSLVMTKPSCQFMHSWICPANVGLLK